ncbi:MAG: hypothetical protein MZV64_22115 [Ignavibacteriales bacterium]|nr:hypothetical protein [Ignavibacteriales bacterium]
MFLDSELHPSEGLHKGLVANIGKTAEAIKAGNVYCIQQSRFEVSTQLMLELPVNILQASVTEIM